MIVLSTLLLGSVSFSSFADESLENKILTQAAATYDAAVRELEIAQLDPVTLPLTELTLYRAKVVDTTGDIYSVVVDGDGTTRDLGAARAAERQARDALYGPVTPALYDRLQTLTGEEKIAVGIWLRTGDLTLPTRQEIRPNVAQTRDVGIQPREILPSGINAEEKTDQEAADGLAARIEALRAEQAARRESLETLHQATIAYLRDEITGVQADLLADLQAQGSEPLYVSPIAPLIFVELSQPEILSLAQRADVDTLYGPTDYADAMDVAKVTQKADVVDRWGFEGAGVDVAILEDSRIETSNPHLNIVDTHVSGDSNVDQHATATGGMVASQHGTYQGIAQDVNLYSANATSYGDSNLSAAMDWAASTIGVDIINNSWGGNASNTDLNVHDRHLDYIVRNVWPTVTVAAGNENGECWSETGRVTSPGRAYNVISVGNYSDGNTETWDDDSMASCSSYVDPSTGVDKPEVAASGSSIVSTTDADPWTGNVGSGTSYATPMVSGEAALLMERSASLMNRPEAVKAIIMATALNNIEGDSRFSDYDGAGGVDMRAAFNLVDQGLWAWRSVTSGSFPYTYSFFAFAGETVRAAIAWDSDPASDYST
ncbi:MAG: S8 family serine peptidase, partial [Anaerolineae bacterium]